MSNKTQTTVHPRSISAALHEYRFTDGGKPWCRSEAELAEIIAEVHSGAKPHNRRREIQLRMSKANVPTPATPQDGEAP